MKWFRLYSSLLHNRKVQSLPAALFKSWINVLCFASDNGDRGRISSVEDLAFALRLKPSKTRKIIDELLKRNLLENGPNGDFFVHDWDDFQQKSDDSRVRVAKFKSQSEPPVSSGNNNLDIGCNGQCNGLEENRTDTDIDKNKNKTPHTPLAETEQPSVADATSTKTAKVSKSLQEFALAFYATYPRKAGKAQALKACAKLKPDSALQNTIFENLTAQIEHRRAREKIGLWNPEWPHPATWINNRRWEDELKPIPLNGQKHETHQRNKQTDYDRAVEATRRVDERVRREQERDITGQRMDRPGDSSAMGMDDAALWPEVVQFHARSGRR